MDGTRAICDVVTGGVVEPHKGVNLPGVRIPIPSLTEKDLVDLEFALGLGVDYVALSFVRAAEGRAASCRRDHPRQSGSSARVIAKIEKAEAVNGARRRSLPSPTAS